MNYQLETVQHFVVQLGEELLQLQTQDLNVFKKNDGTKVSEADYFSERKILEFLKSHSPHPVISEENPDRFLTEEITWVVDPIDGTSHYLREHHDFVIMLALVKNKQPLFSMIYAPALDKGYFAEQGRGAYVFSRTQLGFESAVRIHVDQDTAISKRIFLLSEKKRYQREFDWFQEKSIQQFHLTGSLGLKLCQIAEGRAHYYLNTNDYLKIWDVLPPYLIIQEAGGRVSDIFGHSISFPSDHFQLKQGLFVAPDSFFKAPFSLVQT